MEGVSFKTIFIILIVILIMWALYVNLIKDDKKPSIVENIVENSNNEVLESNNIRIGIVEFDNINPILSNNKNVQDISRLIFDSLFTITNDYKLIPSLAKECSKLDEKTYIIKLRQDVKWQDGNKFEANDVIFTIDMLKKLHDKSIYYYNIKEISLIEEIDEYTIKLITENEIPFYEYNFIFPIISSKYFDEDNLMSESKNNKPVGTGLYYISDTENNSILLKKSSNDWNFKTMKIDTITLNLYDTLSSEINGFKNGAIDLFTTSNRSIEDYLKSTKYNKIEYINRNYEYLVFNCDNNILSNIEVRQAINSAINKEDIVKDIYNNKYKISNFPLDFGSYAYSNNEIILYDQNTAKRLLVDNEWKYNNKRWQKTLNYKYLKIDLNIVTNKDDSNMVKVANKIKEQLEYIGMNIKVIEANEKQYKKYLENKNYDIVIVNSTYSYSPSLNKYFINGNLANYNNDEINSLLNEINNSSDENEIKQKYSRIVEIYNNDVPYISLNFNQNTLIYSQNLKGDINPNSYNLFYNLETWYREYKK